MTETLLVVDMINTFMPDGELPVPGIEKIIEPIKTEIISTKYNDIVYVCDTHTEDSIEFSVHPKHALVNTPMCGVIEELPTNKGNVYTVRKGQDPNYYGYSSFCNSGRFPTNLPRLLRALKTHNLYVCGVATEYCILETVKDARYMDYETTVLNKCITGIDEETANAAIIDMINLGAIIKG